MKEFFERLSLAWKIVKEKDGNLVKFSKSELKNQLTLGKEDPDYWLASGVVDVARVFSVQSHSGYSAPFAINLISKILSFNPISPITGVESEWGEQFDGDGTQQNTRCSTVFKDNNGTAYDIDYYYFAEPDGFTYTAYESRKTIEFPYTKRASVRIDVSEDATPQERLDAIKTFESSQQ